MLDTLVLFFCSFEMCVSCDGPLLVKVYRSELSVIIFLIIVKALNCMRVDFFIPLRYLCEAQFLLLRDVSFAA